MLRAYNPNNLSQVLYDSSQSAGDQGPPAVKFTVPTVGGGLVIVPGEYQVDIYGLRQGSTGVAPQGPLGLMALRRRHR